MHSNKINGKVYIGTTSQKPITRWGHGHSYYHNSYFNMEIEEYGWDNFEHIIIGTGLNKEQAFGMEKDLILQYESTNPDKGYNRSTGGKCGSSGIIRSDEVRHNMSEAHKGQIVIKGIASKETKQKMSEAHKGKIFSDETRKKMSISHKSKTNYNAKKVKNLDTGEIFDTITDAALLCNVYESNLCNCCNGKRETCGGYHWSFLNDVI